MTIHELPPHFEFVFLDELKEDGFAFHLNEQSPYVYLSENMRDELSNKFDESMDEIIFMDLTETTVEEIESKVLKLLKNKEDLYYGNVSLQQKTIADL